MFIVMAVTASFETAELALFCGFFIGVFGKVLATFIRKIQAGEISKFDPKYFWLMIVTFFYMVPVNYAFLTTVDITGLHWLLAAWIGVCLGFGGNWLAEEVYKYIEFLKTAYRSRGSTGQ